MTDQKAFIIGISGCSSSGKTTLARLLRDIFPSTYILHEDDFYKEETELPMKDGLLDWDCAGAIDVPAMAEALTYIRQHASLPPTLDSKEDQNSVGTCPVPSSLITSLRTQILSSLPTKPSPNQPPTTIFLLDGFLLYPPSMGPVPALLDLKLFVRASHAAAKRRREARDGYVTIEGFWSDPPGYVDRVVWPNYVQEHGWMFEGGDVEGAWREDVLEKEGIRVMRGDVDADMGELLRWMADEILELLKKES